MRHVTALPAKSSTKWFVTGRMVFFSLFGFFGVIAAVNAVMVMAAVTTFGGLETASSYKAGLAFAQEEAASRAQAARHWQVTAKLQPQADGLVRIDVTASDGTQNPLIGYEAMAVLSHPTNRWLDQTVVLRTSGAGQFIGRTPFTAGQWDLVIELTRDGERLFRSRQRIQLKAPAQT